MQKILEPKTEPKLDNKEVSDELTVDDYVKDVRYDKARRRDVGDMLAEHQQLFRKGDVREGIAKFMEDKLKARSRSIRKNEQAAALC